jgi:hypothetical protein
LFCSLLRVRTAKIPSTPRKARLSLGVLGILAVSFQNLNVKLAQADIAAAEETGSIIFSGRYGKKIK